MAALEKHRFHLQKENVEDLKQETSQWLLQTSVASEDIRFFIKYVNAGIFKPAQAGFVEILGALRNQLDDTRDELATLHQELRNHQYDLEGMLECDEVSCDAFYQHQHAEIQLKVEQFFHRLRKLQSLIFNSTGDYLLEKRNQN